MTGSGLAGRPLMYERATIRMTGIGWTQPVGNEAGAVIAAGGAQPRVGCARSWACDRFGLWVRWVTRCVFEAVRMATRRSRSAGVGFPGFTSFTPTGNSRGSRGGSSLAPAPTGSHSGSTAQLDTGARAAGTTAGSKPRSISACAPIVRIDAERGGSVAPRTPVLVEFHYRVLDPVW